MTTLLKVPSGSEFLDVAAVTVDNEFSYIPEFGVWHSNATAKPEIYDQKYFDGYVDLKGSEIAVKLNQIRCQMLHKYGCRAVLDIGIGSGEFLECWNNCGDGFRGCGYDVNPVAVKQLKKAKKFVDPYTDKIAVDAVTMWDVLEHIPEPHVLLRKIPLDTRLFISLPVFYKFEDIKASRHYKPGEHIWYWTPKGLTKYLESFGFTLTDTSDAETEAGRSGIRSFSFALPRYI